MSFINIAYAQTNDLGKLAAADFVRTFNDVILFPLIMLMVGVAFLVFLYGCFEYIIHADNQAARETGRQHILWGVIGMFVMLSAYGILLIAAGTFGLDGQLNCANDPTNSGCISGPPPEDYDRTPRTPF